MSNIDMSVALYLFSKGSFLPLGKYEAGTLSAAGREQIYWN